MAKLEMLDWIQEKVSALVSVIDERVIQKMIARGGAILDAAKGLASTATLAETSTVFAPATPANGPPGRDSGHLV